MNYKLFATDFDDTLLADDFTISKENRQALKEAKQAGIEIAIVTGREYEALYRFWDDLNIGDYGVVLGGSQIVRRDGTILDHKYLAENIVKSAYDYIIKNNLYCQVFTGFSYYYNENCHKHDIYTSITNNSGTYNNDLYSIVKDVGKIIIIADEDNVSEMYTKLNNIFSDRCHVVISKPTYIEITDMEATKGSALLRLLHMLGIKREETIAIGDGPIDISMIEVAGLGIAVSNAVDELKKEADYIAPSNNDSAIAHVIEKYIKGVQE